MNVGDVWRKRGPCDWLRIERIHLPGFAGYDGGLPGCSVRFRTWRGAWQKKTWFYPASSEQDFERKMAESFRFMESAAQQPAQGDKE